MAKYTQSFTAPHWIPYFSLFIKHPAPQILSQIPSSWDNPWVHAIPGTFSRNAATTRLGVKFWRNCLLHVRTWSSSSISFLTSWRGRSPQGSWNSDQLMLFWKKINYKIALKTGRKELFGLKAMKAERAKCHQKRMIHWQKSKQHTIPTRGWMHEQPKQVTAGFTWVWGWTWNHLMELDIIFEANTWSERYACNAF